MKRILALLSILAVCSLAGDTVSEGCKDILAGRDGNASNYVKGIRDGILYGTLYMGTVAGYTAESNGTVPSVRELCERWDGESDFGTFAAYELVKAVYGKAVANAPFVESKTEGVCIDENE